MSYAQPALSVVNDVLKLLAKGDKNEQGKKENRKIVQKIM